MKSHRPAKKSKTSVVRVHGCREVRDEFEGLGEPFFDVAVDLQEGGHRIDARSTHNYAEVLNAVLMQGAEL